LGIGDFISDMKGGGLVGFSDRENGYKGYDWFWEFRAPGINYNDRIMKGKGS